MNWAILDSIVAPGEELTRSEMKTFIRLSLLVSLLFPACPANAETLLGVATLNWSASNSVPSFLDVKSMAMELGNTNNPQASDCSIMMIGCEGNPVSSFVNGAIFTYDATHGANFTQVASMLTNGVNDQLWFVTQARDGSGSLVGGVNEQFRLESQQFHSSPDLVGNTVTRITFTVIQFGLGPSGGSGTPGISWFINGTWKIYGTPAAVPAQPLSWGSLKSLYR